MSENDYLENELKAVKLAIENEHKVRAFYLENAKGLKDELARKTFIFLADEELKHAEAINDFMKSIHEGGIPEIEAGSEDEAIGRSKEFFSANIKEYSMKAKASKKEISIYELGLEMEMEGYNFYKKAAEEAKHKNVKALFEFLTKEEDSHYHLIQNALSYFKDPDSYFQSEENWFFEG